MAPFSWPTSKSSFTPFLPVASLLQSSKLLRESSASLLHLAFQLPKLHGKGSPKAAWFHSPQNRCGPPFLAKATWSPPSMAAVPGFKSQCQSSSSSPFPTPPTICYTGQHPHISPAFLSCHSKYRQTWPSGVEPIISKLSHRRCNQGELPPSYITG